MGVGGRWVVFRSASDRGDVFKADFASNPGKMVNKLVQLYAIGNAICLIEDSQVGGGMVQAVVIYVRDGDAWKRRVTYVASR